MRARLLVLLLSLSNSDQVRQQEDVGSDDDNEKIVYEIIHNPRSEITKAAKKAAEIRALLADGEEPCRHFYR